MVADTLIAERALWIVFARRQDPPRQSQRPEGPEQAALAPHLIARSTNSAVSQASRHRNGCSPGKVEGRVCISVGSSSNTPPRFNQQVLIDTTPLPDSIPRVEEIGSSSAPLLSASYFIGARCKPFNDDYMVCKTEAHGTGEIDCLKEGRKVTRCAASV